MNIYKNSYEAYYRNLKRNSTNVQKINPSIKKTNEYKCTAPSIFIYDLVMSLVLVIFMASIKYAQNDYTDNLYSNLTSYIKSDDDKIAGYFERAAYYGENVINMIKESENY